MFFFIRLYLQFIAIVYLSRCTFFSLLRRRRCRFLLQKKKNSTCQCKCLLLLLLLAVAILLVLPDAIVET